MPAFSVLNSRLGYGGWKRVKKLGVRLGNWLTADEARRFWQFPPPDTLKGKRDRAILAVLLGCGLRRRELADLGFSHLQQREDHWAIVDLIGKGGHIRTVPMPEWVIDVWVMQPESRREGCSDVSAEPGPVGATA